MKRRILILSLVIAALLITAAVFLLLSAPSEEPLAQTYSAWKLTFAPDSYTETVSAEPIIVRLNGTVVRYRFKPDFYRGNIAVDGYPAVPWPDDRAAPGEPVFRMNWPEEGLRYTPIYQNLKDTAAFYHLEGKGGNLSGAYVSADGSFFCFPLSDNTPDPVYIITHSGTAEEAAEFFHDTVWASWQKDD